MSDSSFLGTGWSFPPTFESANQQLNLTAGADNINQSINLILQTQRGERSMQPAFGSMLSTFMFRKRQVLLKEEIISAVENGLLECEPRINVESVTVHFPENDEARVEIEVIYVIKTTNSRHNYVYPFSLNEGTNLQQPSHGL